MPYQDRHTIDQFESLTTPTPKKPTGSPERKIIFGIVLSVVVAMLLAGLALTGV